MAVGSEFLTLARSCVTSDSTRSARRLRAHGRGPTMEIWEGFESLSA
jgi:hypothetical protein